MARTFGRIGLVFAVAALGMAVMPAASSGEPQPPGHKCPNPAGHNPPGQCKKLATTSTSSSTSTSSTSTSTSTSSTTTTTTVALADLMTEKVHIESVGGYSYFRVRVINLGPAPADDVAVNDTANTQLVGFYDIWSGGSCSSTGPTTGECFFGSLPVGDTVSFTVQTVFEGHGTGDTVEVTSTTRDPDPLNNVYSVRIDVD